MSGDLLPEYLRKWRKRAGYTQASLSEALGLSRTQVARWETGAKRVPLERFFELADIYSISPAQLMTDPDAPDFADLAQRAQEAGVSRAEIATIVEAYLEARKKSIR